MTTAYLPPNTTIERFDADAVDEAQFAAMSFLARYSGRTLEAYSYDLRCFFQWAADSGLAVLETRPVDRCSRRLLGNRSATLGTTPSET